MADDDRAVMERLAALDAEVKADADAQRARKDVALAKLREQRAEKEAAQAELRARDVSIAKRRAAAREPAAAASSSSASSLLVARGRSVDADDDEASNLGGALKLASKANRVHKELTRAPADGEKSWAKSGLASLVLGPIGWLYAGSMREAIPATAVWVAFALIASHLPTLLLMPLLVVALPASAIAGVMYATQFNRTGKRQRLWGPKDKAGKKQLAP